MVNGAAIVTAFEMRVAKAKAFNKWLYGISQERGTGIDIMASLIAKHRHHNISIFFGHHSRAGFKLGQNKARIYRIACRRSFCSPFPVVDGCGKYALPNQINRLDAELVLVFLGGFKQKIWMANNYQQINGALISIGEFSGCGRLRKRTLLWMQKDGFRMVVEALAGTKRMRKRYLVSNTLFAALIVRQWFNLKFRKNQRI